MKHFGPTPSSKSKYSYSSPIYYGSFGIASLNNEGDFNQLERKTRQALINDDDRTALSYASKAAIEYGIAGLVLYIDTYIQILSSPSSKDEIIEYEISKLLAYIDFASQMVIDKKDAKALRSMQMIYPNDDYESNTYWTEREEKLLSLAKNIEFVTSEAKDMAHELVIECCGSNQSTGLKK